MAYLIVAAVTVLIYVIVAVCHLLNQYMSVTVTTVPLWLITVSICFIMSVIL